MKSPKILLIAMPWNRADYPSVQLGLLKSYLIERNVDVTCAYPYLDLENRLGSELYFRIANNLHPVLGEAFWSTFLTGTVSDQFIELCLACGEFSGEEFNFILEIMTAYLDKLVSEYDWHSIDVLGFSCTFNQLFASLTLAERVKRLSPKIRIIFGGYEVSNERGKLLIDSFPFIDCIVSGPGEAALHHYLQNLPSGKLLIKDGDYKTSQPGIPDYDEFFENALVNKNRVIVPLVASSGCDYGQCAFCTQHADIKYKTLTSTEIQSAIRTICTKYNSFNIEFTDTSFPIKLIDEKWDTPEGVSIFAQIRPMCTSEVFENLKRTGFSGFQIGIEAFNSSMAKKMGKPNGLLQNVHCLKLLHEHDIEITYNLILDFPSFTNEDIKQTIETIPLIYHLQPPSNLLRFNLQLGSKVFNQPNYYNITNVRPHSNYAALTPFYENNQLLPLYYEYDRLYSLDEDLLSDVDDLCRNWLNIFDVGFPLLTWEMLDSKVTIQDRRFGREVVRSLEKVDGEILMRCEYPIKLSALFSLSLVDKSSVETAIQHLAEFNLIIFDSDMIISLPVKKTKHKFKKATQIESYFYRGDNAY